MKKMSLRSRRELVSSLKGHYKGSSWTEKGVILDEFVAATGYNRKYAIKLLTKESSGRKTISSRIRSVTYDEEVKKALVMVWYAANQICSKRLVPFLPQFVSSLEKHGHLELPPAVKEKLLKLSASTMDRLLKSERQIRQRSKPMTRGGSLLKHQIKVRRFSDWEEKSPGFFEADLVAHCGDRTDGVFLNTLVLTDIATGWTECFPLLSRSKEAVKRSLRSAQEILPFSILGLDTDNGGEFINYELLEFCQTHQITFTRSRAYKKNDQAHVEEKNGSIVRRSIGYDRYEGKKAWYALLELYSILRLYVNFFQPSVKLRSKERQGAKVTKSYDTAKTPYQRLLESSLLSEEKRPKLEQQYEALDPVHLLTQLKQKQESLWVYAWKTEDEASSGSLEDQETLRVFLKGTEVKASPLSLCHYKSSKKQRKPLPPRTWRTRKDPFEGVWERIERSLIQNPAQTAKKLLSELIEEFPGDFKPKHLRTLQRRVQEWRNQQGEKDRSELLKQVHMASVEKKELEMESMIKNH